MRVKYEFAKSDARARARAISNAQSQSEIIYNDSTTFVQDSLDNLVDIYYNYLERLNFETEVKKFNKDIKTGNRGEYIYFGSRFSEEIYAIRECFKDFGLDVDIKIVFRANEVNNYAEMTIKKEDLPIDPPFEDLVSNFIKLFFQKLDLLDGVIKKHPNFIKLQKTKEDLKVFDLEKNGFEHIRYKSLKEDYYQAKEKLNYPHPH